MLEQRQKEMMELCKSESDEETPEAEEQTDVIQQVTEETSDITNNESDVITEKSKNAVEQTDVPNSEPITNIDSENNDLAFSQLIENESVRKTSSVEAILNDEAVNNDKPDSLSNAINDEEDTEKNDSNTDLKLVYNDSVEEHLTADDNEGVLKETTILNDPVINNNKMESNSEQLITKAYTEPESQLISLHYTENNTEELERIEKSLNKNSSNEIVDIAENNTEELERTEEPENSSNEIVAIATEEDKQDDFFSDDDVNMEDIDRIIENAEILRGTIFDYLS